jgi:crotonobetainyl-CoA:carnitine CoA-transferase CaiB-like acyl-CoA transferase
MRPLAGIRVVEAASYVSGPFAGLMLADLGADVVKVEPPRGDPHRRFGPLDVDGGVLFRATNRNKRGAAIDLTTESGLGALGELLDAADVFVTNWRPGVAEKFGLTAEHVRARWPQLVWVRVSGYGQTGPMAQLPAFDSISQARVGVAAAIGETPMLLPMYLADKITATYATQTALAGVIQRASTGRGCVADVAMIDAAAHFDTPDLLASHQHPGAYDERIDRMLRAPRPLATADGWIVLAPVSGHQLKRAVLAAGLDAHLDDLRSQPDGLAASERFFEIFDGRLTGRTTAAWMQIFSAADVPASPVMSKAEHLDDEQVVHNQVYRQGEQPGAGLVRRARHPALFDGVAIDTDDLPAPALPPPEAPPGGGRA